MLSSSFTILLQFLSCSIYTLRTSPCFLTPLLSEYDSLLQSISSDILNIHFLDGDSSWIQATLPGSAGGLGIRRAVQLAPSAFLASAAACSDLVYQIVPCPFHFYSIPHWSDALSTWSSNRNLTPLQGSEQLRKRTGTASLCHPWQRILSPMLPMRKLMPGFWQLPARNPVLGCRHYPSLPLVFAWTMTPCVSQQPSDSAPPFADHMLANIVALRWTDSEFMASAAG